MFYFMIQKLKYGLYMVLCVCVLILVILEEK